LWCESCMRRPATMRVVFKNNETFLVCNECASILEVNTVGRVERLKKANSNGT